MTIELNGVSKSSAPWPDVGTWQRLLRGGRAGVSWGRLVGTTPATCAGLLRAAPELLAAPATSLAGARDLGEAAEALELERGSKSQGNSGKLEFVTAWL